VDSNKDLVTDEFDVQLWYDIVTKVVLFTLKCNIHVHVKL